MYVIVSSPDLADMKQHLETLRDDVTQLLRRMTATPGESRTDCETERLWGRRMFIWTSIHAYMQRMSAIKTLVLR